MVHMLHFKNSTFSDREVVENILVNDKWRNVFQDNCQKCPSSGRFSRVFSCTQTKQDLKDFSDLESMWVACCRNLCLFYSTGVLVYLAYVKKWCELRIGSQRSLRVLKSRPGMLPAPCNHCSSWF